MEWRTIMTKFLLIGLLALSSFAKAGCLDTHFSENIKIPNQKLRSIGYVTMGLVGVGIAAAYTGGAAAFTPIFGGTSVIILSGVKFVSNDGKVKALRLVSAANNQNDYYYNRVPNFGDKQVIDKSHYFTPEMNNNQFDKAYRKINRQYERKKGKTLSASEFRDIVIAGNESMAYCSDAKSFKYRNILKYVRAELKI